MQNKQAIQLLEKIKKEIKTTKYDFKSIVEDLKTIREFSMELNNPVLVKAIRLAYEHLEKNDSFLIDIPSDEPIDSDDMNPKISISSENNIESFNYFLDLLLDSSRKNNLLDLKEYNKAFLSS